MTKHIQKGTYCMPPFLLDSRNGNKMCSYRNSLGPDLKRLTEKSLEGSFQNHENIQIFIGLAITLKYMFVEFHQTVHEQCVHLI